MPLTFPVKLTIDECEKFSETLRDVENQQELVLPMETDAPAFGGLASATQAIMTWARLSRTRELRVRGGVEKLADLVDRTLTRPHKFCATMMARVIKDTEAEENLGPILYAHAESAIERQGASSFGQQRGGLCWFVFVDHSSKGFDRNFYLLDQDAKAEVRQLPQIRSVIRSMVEKSVGVVGGGKRLTDEDIQHIGRLFFELFVNTHEHGSRGHDRADWLNPGVRLIYTNAINLAPEAGGDSLKGAPPVEQYLHSLNFGINDRRRFVEISIIDSGLGYKARWNADYGSVPSDINDTLSNEYNILKKCFMFRQTSSMSTTKGNGLPVVLDRLSKLRGFMKIRSGRLSLYRNFVNDPYIDEEDCLFSDWSTSTSNSNQFTEMPNVAGVAVTLMIPLEAKQ